jgi:hypothetical protein
MLSVNRKSSVGIATISVPGGYDSIPDKGKTFSLLHIVQVGSGAHPASYLVGTGCSFAGVKRLAV